MLQKDVYKNNCLIVKRLQKFRKPWTSLKNLKHPVYCQLIDIKPDSGQTERYVISIPISLAADKSDVFACHYCFVLRYYHNSGNSPPV